MITPKDIQPQNVRSESNPNNDNKIRRAWVMLMPDKIKRDIKARFPESTNRYNLYSDIDLAVSQEWIKLMRDYYQESVSNGAKIVQDRNGNDRLEDSYCNKADDKLIQAAHNVVQYIIENVHETMNTLIPSKG